MHLSDAREPLLDKDALAVKDVDGRVGDLAVDAQRQPVLRHSAERALDL